MWDSGMVRETSERERRPLAHHPIWGLKRADQRVNRRPVPQLAKRPRSEANDPRVGVAECVADGWSCRLIADDLKAAHSFTPHNRRRRPKRLQGLRYGAWSSGAGCLPEFSRNLAIAPRGSSLGRVRHALPSAATERAKHGLCDLARNMHASRGAPLALDSLY